jgi:hypothetical protein
MMSDDRVLRSWRLGRRSPSSRRDGGGMGAHSLRAHPDHARDRGTRSQGLAGPHPQRSGRATDCGFAGRRGPRSGPGHRDPCGGSLDGSLGAEVTAGPARARGSRSVEMPGFHARAAIHGGRKMGVARREGWGATASSGRREGTDEAGSSTTGHHAHNPSRMRIVPAGTDGTVGPSSHHRPRQGLGDGEPESGRAGALAFLRSVITPCRNEGSSMRSLREVTRCEQPARTPAGASRIQTRSGNTAPAGNGAPGLEGENLVISATAGFDSSTA